MEREGVLIDCLKKAAAREAAAIADARAGGENGHLADGRASARFRSQSA